VKENTLGIGYKRKKSRPDAQITLDATGGEGKNHRNRGQDTQILRNKYHAVTSHMRAEAGRKVGQEDDHKTKKRKERERDRTQCPGLEPRRYGEVPCPRE